MNGKPAKIYFKYQMLYCESLKSQNHEVSYAWYEFPRRGGGRYDYDFDVICEKPILVGGWGTM
jgi:hypothetical protein